MSLRKARADIRLKPGAPLDVAKLREAVAKAGFTPTWVKFQALGRLVEQDGQLVFKPKGSEHLIPVEDTEKVAELGTEVLGKDIAIIALIPEKKETAQIESVRFK